MKELLKSKSTKGCFCFFMDAVNEKIIKFPNPKIYKLVLGFRLWALGL